MLTSRGCFLQENTCLLCTCPEKHLLESLFNSEYCEIFKSTYFEEHLQSAATENVFMKLGKN